MELKVWVEGIQRVVCGANYSTTCQDVVLALAHAMGRTGRFTLVERWRDTERPLTPAECPLQALHKWGEYAAEVRFFLIQADGNTANISNNSIGSGSSRSSRDGDKAVGNKTSTGNTKSQQIRDSDGVIPRPRDSKLPHGRASGPFFPSSPSPSPRGGFQSGLKQTAQKPTSQSQLHHLQQSDHLKRSSTFSGAHNYTLQPPPTTTTTYTNNISMPSSSYGSSYQYSNGPYRPQQQSSRHLPPPSPSSSRKPQPSSIPNYSNQTSYGHQPHPQKTRRESRDHHSSLVPPMTNGGDQSMSGNSSSNSSPRSPSGLSASHLYNVQGSHSQPQTSSASYHPRVSSGGPSGEQRDNIPRDSREVHPANTAHGKFPSSDPGPTPRGMSAATSGRPSENSSAGRTSQPNPDARHRHPRRERRPRSPTPHRSGHGGQQQHSQSYSSLPQSKQDQQMPYSQHQYHPSDPSHPSAPQRYHHHPASSSHFREGPLRSSPSISPVPPVPAPRQRARPSPDPVEYENILTSRGRDPQRNHHPPQQHPQEYQSHQQPHKPPSPRRYERSQSRDRRRDEVGDVARNGSGATRALPAPQASGGQPIWSQAGRNGDTQRQQQEQHPSVNPRQQYQQQQLSKSLPASGMNLLRRSNEGGRSAVSGSMDFVESAAKRQHQQQPGHQASTGRSGGDIEEGREGHMSNVDVNGRLAEGGRSMSSFASAVANIRQHSKERLPRGGGGVDWHSEGHQPSVDSNGGDVSQVRSTRDPALSSYHEGPDKAYLPPQTANSRFFNQDPQQKRNNYLGGQSSQHNRHVQQHVLPDQHFPYPHTNPQKTPSPREPTSPPLFTLSPRHNSAFKEVSPRHSHQPSPSSPPVAFSFDQNKHHAGATSREFPHQTQEGNNNHPREGDDRHLLNHLPSDTLPGEERPHFRQLSLEVEEYDLDQNFPDLSQRDRDFGVGVLPTPARETVQRPTFGASAGTTNHAESTPLEYRLDSGGVRPAPHRAEAEYLQLARLVSVQQDRIKVIEAQIADASAEISTLEEEASRTDLQLQELSVDGAELEATEAELLKEEAELECVEWDNVLDGEQKREADIRQQVSRLQEKSKETEERIQHLKSEEEEKTKHIKAEKEKLAAEEKKKIMLEKELSEQVDQVKLELKQVDFTLESQKKEMEKLEAELSEANNRSKKQEEELKEVEDELKKENLKDFHAHPVQKEPPPGVTTVEDFVFPTSGFKKAKPYTSTSSDTVDDDTEDSAPDTGEAIIKILEGRLSPSSPLSEELNKMAGMTSAQQTYKSALAAKNPNGVWV